MTTTQTISRPEAERLLELTARVNLTGNIGSANSGHYTLPQALDALARCTADSIGLETLDGLSILKATDTALGQHRFYVHLSEPKRARDPWA